jgi:hypothetical protein
MYQNHMRSLLDGMSAQWQKDRAKSQMTLGDVIKTLEAMPGEATIEILGELDSYRGYYDDLAFEPTPERRTVLAVLKECRAAMGKVFGGYKGGDYQMGEMTPIWVAEYGNTGMKLISINPDGTVLTASDDA